MTWSRRLPITSTETLIGAVLLGLAMLELFASDEQPHPITVGAFLVAAVPPIAVAFSRRHAEMAVAAAAACLLIAAAADSPSGVLGSGLSYLVLGFALAAWSARPVPGSSCWSAQPWCGTCAPRGETGPTSPST